MIDRFTGKYGFLSNFWPCTIVYQGFIFPSTENAYQAAKSSSNGEFGPGWVPRKIFLTCSAALAKKEGRRFTVREDWNTKSVKIDVMWAVCSDKFYQEEFKRLLLATGNQELVEGNTWNDQFWGVCRGEGKNWLGRILMDIRHQLKINEIGK